MLKAQLALRTALPYIVVLLLSAFFITTSVRVAFNALPLYVYGFERYGASERTGVTPSDLEQVARDLIAYFNSDREPLIVRTRVQGVQRELFNAREVAHMKDVHALVQGLFRWQTATLVALGVYIVGGFAFRGKAFAGELGWALFWGGAVTLGLFVLFAALVTVGFSHLFLLFHILSFSNEFWLLDPSRDYLVMLFPAGFWFDAALAVAVATALQAVAALVIGLVVTRAQHARLRRLRATAV